MPFAAAQDQQQRERDTSKRGDPGEQRLDRGDGRTLEGAQATEKEEQREGAKDQPEHDAQRRRSPMSLLLVPSGNVKYAGPA